MDNETILVLLLVCLRLVKDRNNIIIKFYKDAELCLSMGDLKNHN